MILIVVATVLIYGSLMPLVARLLLGEKEQKHQGKKIRITSGRQFNQTPACELANAFNYSAVRPQAALNNTTNRPISNAISEGSVDLSELSDSRKSAGKESRKSASEISEFVHENEFYF